MVFPRVFWKEFKSRLNVEKHTVVCPRVFLMELLSRPRLRSRLRPRCVRFVVSEGWAFYFSHRKAYDAISHTWKFIPYFLSGVPCGIPPFFIYFSFHITARRTTRYPTMLAHYSVTRTMRCLACRSIPSGQDRFHPMLANSQEFERCRRFSCLESCQAVATCV